MNPKEIKTVKEAAERFMKDISVEVVPTVSNSVLVQLPLLGLDGLKLHFFIIKRKETRRFSLIFHTTSFNILPITETLEVLQDLLHTYGLLLSQDGIIMEENIKIPLHKRIAVLSQALIGIDSLRRLLQVGNIRRTQDAESKEVGSQGRSANGS